MPGIMEKSEPQKVAEAEVDSFRKNLGPFVVAAEATRMPMVFTDAKETGNPIIFANDAFLRLTGYDRNEVLGQNFTFLMARGANADSIALLDKSFASKGEKGIEICYSRKDGSAFWSAILISPVRDPSGDIVQHFASLVDLTDHKREEERSRMLIDELNHRVKNTLATVQSIVWQALRNSNDPDLIRESIESRLFALSRSHDLLTRENWAGAGLRDLIEAALEPFGVSNGRAEHFAISGANVRVNPNAALALGIAFHELATNAVKYGAFSNKAGSVRINWTLEPTQDGDAISLTWQEKNGPPVSAPSRKGFGSRVIEQGLSHELGGTSRLDYRRDGLICSIRFPAPVSHRDD